MNEEEYYKYLTTRSKLSFFYRTNILYPAIDKHLSGKVLDVGCGIGDFLAYRTNNTIGIDINDFNLQYCKKNNHEVYKIENNTYPFSNETFDGAVLDNVLEHLVSPEITINEINRILKLNGVLVIGVPGKKGYTMDSDHKKFYEEKEMNELLLNCGFKNVKYLYPPLFFKSDFVSNKMSQYCIYGVFKKVSQV